MFKKRVIILFFTLFLVNLSAESINPTSDKKYMDAAYEKDVDTFFCDGFLIQEEDQAPLSIYKEKNSNGYYNFSLKIKDDIYKSVSTETEVLLNLNKKKVDDKTTITDTKIPFDILNYALINRDYIVLSKPGKFSYKNLPSYKILVKEKKPLPKEEEKIVEIKAEEEDKSEKDEASENESDLEDGKASEEGNSSEEDSASDQDDQDDQDTKKKVIEYKPAKYKKVICVVSAKDKIVLKKDFYLKKEDKKPLFTIEAEEIKYIKGNYIVTNVKITNVKKKESVTLKYNFENILTDKDSIPAEFKNLYNFNGVK